MKKILSLMILGIFVALPFAAAANPYMAKTYTNEEHGAQFNYPQDWEIFPVNAQTPNQIYFSYPGVEGENYVMLEVKPLDLGMTTEKWFNQGTWPGGKGDFKTWSFRAPVMDDRMNLRRNKITVKENKVTGTMYLVDHLGVLYRFDNGVSQTRGVVDQKVLRNVVKSMRFLKDLRFGE